MSKDSKSRMFSVTIDNQDLNLCFSSPDQEDLFEVDKTYRIIYSEAIRKGIMTEIQARRIHNESGTWTEQHDKEIREFAQNIAQLEVVLRASDPTDPESLQLASNINTIRAEMMSKIGDKQELFANTAEGLATEQKMHTFIARCCIVKDSGDRFFKDMEAYKRFVSEDPDQMSLIHKEAYFYEYKLPEEIAGEWAEIEFVDRLNEEVKKKNTKKNSRKTKRKAAKKTTKKKATKKKAATKKKRVAKSK